MLPTDQGLSATHPSINQTTAEPKPGRASILQLAAHSIGPALINYSAGALITSGAGLVLTGVAALPGLIMMGIGAAAFVINTTLLTCHLPTEFETGDYLLYSCRCFVWGGFFMLTLPTIILLRISMDCLARWMLNDPEPEASRARFSSDIRWLFLPDPRDALPDQLGFSGLEC